MLPEIETAFNAAVKKRAETAVLTFAEWGEILPRVGGVASGLLPLEDTARYLLYLLRTLSPVQIRALPKEMRFTYRLWRTGAENSCSFRDGDGDGMMPQLNIDDVCTVARMRALLGLIKSAPPTPIPIKARPQPVVGLDSVLNTLVGREQASVRDVASLTDSLNNARALLRRRQVDHQRYRGSVPVSIRTRRRHLNTAVHRGILTGYAFRYGFWELRFPAVVYNRGSRIYPAAYARVVAAGSDCLITLPRGGQYTMYNSHVGYGVNSAPACWDLHIREDLSNHDKADLYWACNPLEYCIFLQGYLITGNRGATAPIL